jgi:hypothetical protein
MKRRNTLRQAYQQLLERYDKNPEMTETEIWGMMESFGVEYDKEAAARQWKKRKVAGLVAKARDDKGVRVIYATRNDLNETVYVHVENECRSKPLSEIRKDLGKKRAGILKAYRKVQKLEVKAVSAEQLSLFAAMEAEKKKSQNE